MRFFLLDKVTAVHVGEMASGVKCVTFTDEVLHDHFPDHPIMPGTLIVEGMAQLAGFLLEVSTNTSDAATIRRAVLAMIDRMKFHDTTGPGECLHYEARIHSMHATAAQVDVTARVGETIRAAGKLNFALLEIKSEQLTQQRLQLYRIWTAGLSPCPTLR